MLDLPQERPRELAMCIPSACIQGYDTIKTLLLFFDGVSVNSIAARDPGLLEDPLFGPLFDMGLADFHQTNLVFDEDERIDQTKWATQHWAHHAGTTQLGAFLRRLPVDDWSTAIAEVAVQSLEILYALPTAEVLRQTTGNIYEPVSTWPEFTKLYFEDSASLWRATRTDVIFLDMQTVTFNLDAVPLDEVLDFRREHGSLYTAYRRGLNRLMVELSTLPKEDSQILLLDRREELQDLRDELQRRTRLGFSLRKLAPFGLGMAGAALTLGSGDPIGAAGSAVGALSSMNLKHGSLGSYTYLFAAQENWKNR